MTTDTLLRDITDLKIIYLDESSIRISIGRLDIARIDTNRCGNRLKNRTGFVEGRNRINFIYSRSEHIFVFVLRYRTIGYLRFCSRSQ